MIGISLGFVVEGMVAILLATTIGYCITLNRKLQRLHADRATLGKMVADLVQATALANAAVQELKTAALEAETTLSSRVKEAETFGIELTNHLAAGTALMDKIAKITSITRSGLPAEEKPEPEGGKMQSALAQLAMRPRIRGNAA